MASPFATPSQDSPFVLQDAAPAAPAPPADPFLSPFLNFHKSPFQNPVAGAQQPTNKTPDDEMKTPDAPTNDPIPSIGIGSGESGLNYALGVLQQTVSQVVRFYPSQLEPRPSVDLDISPDDVIATPEVLGSGGWGDVVRGLYGDRDVAIKYIRYQGDPTMIKFLQHEFNVLARLKHENILTFYGGSLLPKPEIFLIQELMVQSVANLMYGKNGSKGRKLELMEALRIGRDVLKGLAYLHKYNVVHRDIKPDNTLLAADGAAKIGDFGLARFKLHTMLQTGSIDVGTSCYMGPECFDPDLGGITLAADIYSFAVTLWEMIMHERPFKEYKEAQILWNLLQKARPRMPDPSPDFPAPVMALIYKCWSQNPRQRPTAQQALDFVETLLANGVRYNPDDPLNETVIKNAAERNW